MEGDHEKNRDAWNYEVPIEEKSSDDQARQKQSVTIIQETEMLGRTTGNDGDTNGGTADARYYYSQLFGRYEKLPFFRCMVLRVIAAAQIADEGSTQLRLRLSDSIDVLLGKPNLFPRDDLIYPAVVAWFKRSLNINLFALEILFHALTTGIGSSHLIPSTTSYRPTFDDDLSSPFSNNLPAIMSQLEHLVAWKTKLDKLPMNQRACIWKVARFTAKIEGKESPSFKEVISFWASEPLKHLCQITALFGAVGHLKSQGFLKLNLGDAKSAKISVFEEETESMMEITQARRYDPQMARYEMQCLEMNNLKKIIVKDQWSSIAPMLQDLIQDIRPQLCFEDPLTSHLLEGISLDVEREPSSEVTPDPPPKKRTPKPSSPAIPIRRSKRTKKKQAISMKIGMISSILHL
eukprot:TRINITY_DN7058_c0_g1_i1.p1 TRINITY_DN7058_c0_g1~~TRINITY_DN7058_c0_g1_i1.p1  ORF type:complete len:406 (-),score=79.36 TRINITY_DN7058_c0_g1_i1:26-1243(-)